MAPLLIGIRTSDFMMGVGMGMLGFVYRLFLYIGGLDVVCLVLEM